VVTRVPEVPPKLALDPAYQPKDSGAPCRVNSKYASGYLATVLELFVCVKYAILMSTKPRFAAV